MLWPRGRPRNSAWRRILSPRESIVAIALISILVVVAVAAPLLTPLSPIRLNNPPLLPPFSGDHHFGTTASGQDLFAAIVYGARTSLVVGLAVAALSTGIGLMVGSLAAYLGGWREDVLMRIVDVFLVLPRFFLALLVIAIFGQGLEFVILVLALLSWPPTARVVRAECQSLLARDYVQAARAAGARHSWILFREVLPGAFPIAVVIGSLQISQAILTEAALSFIGLGDPNVPSWGQLLVDAQRFLTSAPWMVLFPGIAITTAIVSFNLLGDGLARALNPRPTSNVVA